MQIPETPSTIDGLDLMRRLEAYADGEPWLGAGTQSREEMKTACRALHNRLAQLESVVAPLLGRVAAHEMETFTMHDRRHALKVAHLMWHILSPSEQVSLTPPEIGILVASAFLHDLGMAMSPEERAHRLDPGSDLWDLVDVDESVRTNLRALSSKVDDQSASTAARMHSRRRLDQAEEALLTLDTRGRHATRTRYYEVLAGLADFHRRDPVRIPDLESCLSFDGDSFLAKVVDICVSHNQGASVLVQSDPEHPGRPRFPRDYPIGRSSVDLHMAAAALRLSDILDFDRERTPSVLFYYLLPTALAPDDDPSVMAWSKHMAISNWHIDDGEIVFRGHCRDHVVHHAIVQFAAAISNEIAATRATFASLEETSWPFALPEAVRADIFEEGYRYVPYRFELDDERVYGLLMGGAIYDDPLVAVRELVQNAVDACTLRDALTSLHEPYSSPATTGRIIITYQEPSDGTSGPRLIVEDTGTGMDGWIIERWFLKVGQSYYASTEFAETRINLRRKGLDFAPISEFGVGFLSCFLLADRVLVETAMWEAVRGDTRKRTLQIDGPTRLIRLHEESNEGAGRFKGTRVTLYLTRWAEKGSERASPPKWDGIRAFLRGVCVDLPYQLRLVHVSGTKTVEELVNPRPLVAYVPPHLASIVTKILVSDTEYGLEGEIALVNPYMAARIERQLGSEGAVFVAANGRKGINGSDLVRGGFRVGWVPGLPDSFVASTAATARLRLKWESRENRRYLRPKLARDALVAERAVARRVAELWLSHLLDNVDSLGTGQIFHLSLKDWNAAEATWMERYDAYTLYKLARQGWVLLLDREDMKGIDLVREWEQGKGKALWRGPFDTELHWQIFDLIMPRVSLQKMGPEARFWIAPPAEGWQDVLTVWRDFVTNPSRWGYFVEFVGGISDLLFYEYPRADYFNSRFQDRLRDFPEELYPRLLRLLSTLVSARRWPRSAELSPDEIDLFQRVLEKLGDLMVGSIHDAWRIDSFRIT